MTNAPDTHNADQMPDPRPAGAGVPTQVLRGDTTARPPAASLRCSRWAWPAKAGRAARPLDAAGAARLAERLLAIDEVADVGAVLAPG